VPAMLMPKSTAGKIKLNMLPCSVIVQELKNNEIEAAVDPVASMMAIENQGLVEIATEIKENLEAIVLCNKKRFNLLI
jgi:uncharacterized protein (DUF302 family)